MSPEQRQALRAIDGKAVKAGDPRWSTITSWQRGGLIRVVPLNAKVARIEMTDAGRAAVRQGAADA